MQNLPAGMDAHRILPESEAALFCGINPSTWRRMLRKGATPAPITLSPRRRGYTLASLLDWQSARRSTANGESA